MIYIEVESNNIFHSSFYKLSIDNFLRSKTIPESLLDVNKCSFLVTENKVSIYCYDIQTYYEGYLYFKNLEGRKQRNSKKK